MLSAQCEYRSMSVIPFVIFIENRWICTQIGNYRSHAIISTLTCTL